MKSLKRALLILQILCILGLLARFAGADEITVDELKFYNKHLSSFQKLSEADWNELASWSNQIIKFFKGIQDDKNCLRYRAFMSYEVDSGEHLAEQKNYLFGILSPLESHIGAEHQMSIDLESNKFICE